ncbi:RND family transporter [Mycolicibacterium brumae]|uniref:MMPL family transporter n=1 Tax=Mycolicibacterium brumae TaxID=85968 RepID=A0A2G5PGP0_9MYCO|nr:MMPL family transporter [Mycolicibacterium brumae]MCV7192522.1 MMPL family transporter [Mycolicibacterium brumae]PIB77482.1 MMPL family transporter [Mycolicibacterium brumae]RWA18486.1 membrane protein [Mycolicibacterium brumae DSM 44177]UWW10291.1 MMPL family transporter [Mycolicibacterium brumae]
MSDTTDATTTDDVHRSRPARTVRALAVPILLFWVAVAALTNALGPQLEIVGYERSVSMNSPDSPSRQAMLHIGQVFGEFDSDSSAMIVLEGDDALGADAHAYYDKLVRRLRADTEHVQHVQDFWGDPLTAGGSQSKDGKAAYVQIYLVGDMGQARANKSVEAVRHIVADEQAPPGVRAYVTGAAPLLTDQFDVGSEGTDKVTMLTFGVISLMLFLVYRSVLTTALMMVVVLVEVAAARGVVATLANSGIIGLSTYSTNLLTLLVIAAGTDWAIFLVGRYQETRNTGRDREHSYYGMFSGTAHVIVGSGLTIAGAVLCLSFARLPYFQSLGLPAALGVLVTLAAALTLGPAMITIAGRFGWLDPKRATKTRGWRRIGTSIARWPGPIFVVSCLVALIGLLSLSGYRTNYDVRPYMPAWAPANVGYQAAERHFSASRLNPELLMIETDRDMRNPADMILLERVAKSVLHTRGIALVQSITRPLGTPITHSSIPFLLSAQSAGQVMNLSAQQEQSANMLSQAGEISKSIETLRQQLALQTKSAEATDAQVQAFHETVKTVDGLRDKLADFDDFLRPIRNYFYWEPHCFDIPVCAAMRSVFDALDGISDLSEKFSAVTASLDQLNELQPQLLALLTPQIETQQRNLELTMSNYALTNGMTDQAGESLQTATALGKAFDEAKNDDSFYLPPEAFENPAFQRGLKLFLSPDGHAARMIITHEGDPATPEGIEHVDAIKEAAFDAIKATPLADAKVYVAGTAAMYKDIADGARYDLMISALSALALILLVMMFITRSLVAALVIVGTVVLSLGASFGLSVLLWQHIFGINLYWIVQALAIILLLAVGADYNLLLISRFREEVHAGLKTGIIRAMGGTGAVVTAAGLVFAVTMAAFIVSDLRVLGQIGTTIGLGLMFDTLIVRSFMTPSTAALLGRWFWWPQNIRPRPASEMLRPYGPRTAVRELLGRPAN